MNQGGEIEESESDNGNNRKSGDEALRSLFDPPKPNTIDTTTAKDDKDDDDDEEGDDTIHSTTMMIQPSQSSEDFAVSSITSSSRDRPPREITTENNDNYDDTINSMAGLPSFPTPPLQQGQPLSRETTTTSSNKSKNVSVTTTNNKDASNNLALTPTNTRNLTIQIQGENLTQLQGLFAPPPAVNDDTPKPPLPQQYTGTTGSTNIPDKTGSLSSLFAPPSASVTTLSAPQETTSLLRDVETDNRYITTPENDRRSNQKNYFFKGEPLDEPRTSSSANYFQQIKCICTKYAPAPTTIAGSFMFLLYHVVFCLAMGSAIIRPHHLDKPILGTMAKFSTVGIMFVGPFYIHRLGKDIPALYPSIDLFLAPFLAQAAVIIDDTLVTDIEEDYNDKIFWASFSVLVGIGMLLAGLLLVLAASWKLANLGTYLPYSVLCGFFSAVGVLLWALAFSVDTSGRTWQMVFLSSDSNSQEMINALKHHLPSLFIGILMNRLGPKSPFFVILLIVLTLGMFYMVIWLTGTSLEDAQEEKWFWSSYELTGSSSNNTADSSFYGGATENGWEDIFLPPMPFSNIACLLSKYTHWKAVWAGLQNMIALAFLYLLRSSIHASAMKKNVNNLVRRIPIRPSTYTSKRREDNPTTNINVDTTPMMTPMSTASQDDGHESYAAVQAARNMRDSVKETVRMVNMSLADPPVGGEQASSSLESTSIAIIPSNTNNNNTPNQKARRVSVTIPIHHDSDGNPVEGTKEEDVEEICYEEIRAKPSKKTLEAIFEEYGYALLLVATTGGFGNCPTVATSNTMYAIGAEAAAPQYGSILLLVIFYLTDFNLVRYIPKAAFSSLLVLGAVDTLVVWFIGAFHKTLDWSEWLVVPFIVAFSLVVGFLNAVFLGIGISMFVFVGSFFRVGVVKFNATCLELRSRIERSIQQSTWLDENGDLVQVLVLQNYLFFGNATSVLNFINTMFDDEVGLMSSSEVSVYNDELPPFPKVLILDLGLTTGMDTSTADIFAEIKELCKNNGCKLFLCSLDNRIKKGLALAGIKPEHGNRSERLVRFFADLDTALGKAEDYLLESEGVIDKHEEQMMRFPSPSMIGIQEDGFRYALRQIDELHGLDFAAGLEELAAFVHPIELLRGCCLFQSDGGVVQESERGLFFIESGLLKIERDAKQTMTMTRTRSYQSLGPSSMNTLRNRHARMGSVPRRRAAEKSERGRGMSTAIRVARFGPGWVAGTYENASGFRGGVAIAMTASVKLHHLSFQKLEELETTHPSLILKLYKLLSFLMSRKEEIMTAHLSTLHTIMTSPPQSKPISRSAVKAFAGIPA